MHDSACKRILSVDTVILLRGELVVARRGSGPRGAPCTPACGVQGPARARVRLGPALVQGVAPARARVRLGPALVQGVGPARARVRLGPALVQNVGVLFAMLMLKILN